MLFARVGESDESDPLEGREGRVYLALEPFTYYTLCLNIIGHPRWVYRCDACPLFPLQAVRMSATLPYSLAAHSSLTTFPLTPIKNALLHPTVPPTTN